MRMGTILVGGVPESDAFIISCMKEVCQPFYAKLAGLVGVISPAICACTHGHPGNLDTRYFPALSCPRHISFLCPRTDDTGTCLKL